MQAACKQYANHHISHNTTVSRTGSTLDATMTHNYWLARPSARVSSARRVTARRPPARRRPQPPPPTAAAAMRRAPPLVTAKHTLCSSGAKKNVRLPRGAVAAARAPALAMGEACAARAARGHGGPAGNSARRPGPRGAAAAAAAAAAITNPCSRGLRSGLQAPVGLE